MSDKLLPTDRTALAKQRLQQKLALKQLHHQQALSSGGAAAASRGFAALTDDNATTSEDDDDGEVGKTAGNKKAAGSRGGAKAAASNKPSPPAAPPRKKADGAAAAASQPPKQPAIAKAVPAAAASGVGDGDDDASEGGFDDILADDANADATATAVLPMSEAASFDKFDSSDLVTAEAAGGATAASSSPPVASRAARPARRASPTTAKTSTSAAASHHATAATGDGDDAEPAASGDVDFDDHGVLLSESATDFPRQHFEYFLLLDFEATCENVNGFDHEIIEVPALLFDTKTLQVVDTFHSYVRPLRNPRLTDFCIGLTGITQDKVDAAPCYDEVLASLVAWTGDTLGRLTGNRTTDGTRCCVMTDGPCDLELFGYMFMHKRDGFAYPSLFHRYLDVKQTFRDEYGNGKFMKIKDMLIHFGLQFRGQQHSGIDDTKNLARIVSKMIRAGTVFDTVYNVTHTSARARVPQYLWTKARLSVANAVRDKTMGRGPAMANAARGGSGASGRGAGGGGGGGGAGGRGLSAITDALSADAVWSWMFMRVAVRRGEYATAPSNGLLALLFVLFIASYFVR